MYYITVETDGARDWITKFIQPYTQDIKDNAVMQ